MKKTKHTILVVVSIAFVTLGFAQHRSYTVKNGFALGAGLTQYNINTNNFNTSSGSGWLITASSTADIPHKWFNVSFGMQLSENNMEISGLMLDEDVLVAQQLDYNIFAAQLSMLFHIKAVKNLLTLDVGPVLQYNGKLELQSENRDALFIAVGDNTFLAQQLEDVSQFNVNGAIGTTLGFKAIKLRAQYIYGFTNIFSKLNSENITSVTLRGNQSMLTFSALLTF